MQKGRKQQPVESKVDETQYEVDHDEKNGRFTLTITLRYRKD